MNDIKEKNDIKKGVLQASHFISVMSTIVHRYVPHVFIVPIIMIIAMTP